MNRFVFVRFHCSPTRDEDVILAVRLHLLALVSITLPVLDFPFANHLFNLSSQNFTVSSFKLSKYPISEFMEDRQACFVFGTFREETEKPFGLKPRCHLPSLYYMGHPVYVDENWNDRSSLRVNGLQGRALTVTAITEAQGR